MKTSFFALVVALLAVGSLVTMPSACSSTQSLAVADAGPEGSAVVVAGGDIDGGVEGEAFTPTCNGATAPLLLAQFHPQKTPDYYAVRTEVLEMGDGGTYSDLTSPWSAMQTQEVGTACKTATDVAGCMTKLASLKQLSASTCNAPIVSKPLVCVFNYLVATQGDDVIALVDFNASFTAVFGAVTSWQEAVTIAQNQVVFVSERDCTSTPPAGYRVTAAGFDVLTYDALPFLSDCFGWTVIHVNPDATTATLMQSPSSGCEE